MAQTKQNIIFARTQDGKKSFDGSHMIDLGKFKHTYHENPIKDCVISDFH